MQRQKLPSGGIVSLATTVWANAAEYTDDVIKIGVLNDRSGTYSDLAGNGSVESEGSWDSYKVRAVAPAAECFRPMKDGGCPLVKS